MHIPFYFTLKVIGLIAGRIYWIHRRSASLGRSSSSLSLVTPMVLIIESGAIYSVALSFQIGLYATGSFGLYIVYNSVRSLHDELLLID